MFFPTLSGLVKQTPLNAILIRSMVCGGVGEQSGQSDVTMEPETVCCITTITNFINLTLVASYLTEQMC